MKAQIIIDGVAWTRIGQDAYTRLSPAEVKRLRAGLRRRKVGHLFRGLATHPATAREVLATFEAEDRPAPVVIFAGETHQGARFEGAGR